MTKSEYFAAGMAKVKENDLEKAVELFTKVLELDATDANALSQRAVCYLNMEKYDLSMFDMNLAIEHDPDYAFRYQCRGYLKARLQDFEGAVADYEKAVELEPEDAIALNNLALAQEQLGYAKKAKANFDKSDKLSGIKTTEERAKERKLKAEKEKTPIKTVEENKKDPEQTKGDIAKSVLTDKKTFKEFIRFIGNGFKLKENDKG